MTIFQDKPALQTMIEHRYRLVATSTLIAIGSIQAGLGGFRGDIILLGTGVVVAIVAGSLLGTQFNQQDH